MILVIFSIIGLFSNNKFIEKIHFKSENVTQIPNANCLSNFCIHIFVQPKGFYSNLTVLSVNVSSPETSYCLYHGLYLGEKWNYKHATIDEICSEYKTSSETSMTSYYTRGKSLYMALYWYKNYSFITATVSLNVTKCQAVYLNICEYHHYCTGNFSSDDFKGYMSNIARKTSLKFRDCDGFLKMLTFEFKSRECVILVLFDEMIFWKH